MIDTNILKMIGLKDVSNIEDIKHRVSKFATEKEFSFIRDSDAHDIDTIKDTCFFVRLFLVTGVLLCQTKVCPNRNTCLGNADNTNSKFS